MTRRSEDLAARKALLAAQANLARMQAALAWQELREIVAPPPSSERSAGARRTAAFIVGIAAPLFGRTRFARVMRFASIAAAAFRVLRSMRAGG